MATRNTAGAIAKAAERARKFAALLEELANRTDEAIEQAEADGAGRIEALDEEVAVLREALAAIVKAETLAEARDLAADAIGFQVAA